MSRFRYVAVDASGLQIKGQLDARNEGSVRQELLRQNLEVLHVKARRSIARMEITKTRVKLSEVMHFSRQMGAFVRSGIPIVNGLEVIAKGSSNKRFREILYTMRDQIRQGVPFADALAEHADILPPYYMGIIRSAELTGRLDVALEHLAHYIERELEAKSKIKAATTYPAIVLLMSIVTVGILTIWVLPKFTDFFAGFNAELPLTTRMMMNLSQFSRDYWFVYPLGLVAFAGVVMVFQKTRRGRRVRDRLLLRIPVIGEVVLYSVVERICRVLSAMSQAGVPVPDAMSAAIVGANNTVFERGLKPAQERMLEGDGLAGPIENSKLFPDAAVQMLHVGETTGTLDAQLENAADFYSTELEYKLKRLTTLFEPIVIVMMGLVVGFVALALVQAMYGIYDAPALQEIQMP